jgi:hypothetical protein
MKRRAATAIAARKIPTIAVTVIASSRILVDAVAVVVVVAAVPVVIAFGAADAVVARGDGDGSSD